MTPPRALSKVALGVRRLMEEVYGPPRGECYRWSSYVACDLLDSAPSRPVWLSTGNLTLGSHLCPHTWVECNDWIVDITADQFNHLSPTKFPEVWLVPRTSRSKKHISDRRWIVCAR